MEGAVFYMNRKLNLFVKILIWCGMGFGIVLMAFITHRAAGYTGISAVNGKPGWQFFVSYALTVLCFLGAEYIAWTLQRMMRSLDSDPFVRQNVAALKRMGFVALGVMACGLATLLLQAVPLAVVFAVPIGMCGLFSLVLSGVFERAVAFKQENDLTV